MIQTNLDRAVNKFGDNITIKRESGDVSTKGKISLSRRFSTPWNVENIRQGIFSSTPTIVGGDILYHIIKDVYYFVYLKGIESLSNVNIAQQITLLKINKTGAIYRLSGTAGSMGGTKQTFTIQKENIKCHLREVTGDLRIERPALLQVASFLLYMQSAENLKILDRIIIGDDKYQVEYLDKNTFNGLFETQLSLDKR